MNFKIAIDHSSEVLSRFYLKNLVILPYLILFSCGEISKNEQASDEEIPPNIVLVLTDDLGYNDLGTYGQMIFSTPRLDQMAKNGAKFTNFYATPICTPSRAALMTACYPLRVGLPFVVAPKGPEWTYRVHDKGLNPKEETIAELLQERGYETACIGKWHLGHHKEHLPTKQGFDEYFGIPYSNDMLPYKGYPNLPLLENETVFEYNPDQSQLTRRYTERALAFIEENRTKPFFLYLAHSMPHVPLYRSKEFVNRSGAGVYGDVIEEIDDSVGRILDKLNELDLSKNTLVVFTSDNGPWLVFGDHAGSAYPLRGGKHTVFEGGMRVPFIAQWPGKIKPGTVDHNITGLIDILPTLCKIAGADLPEAKIDGVDISGLLFDNPNTSPREVHFYGANKAEAIRKGDWKLHIPHNFVRITEPGLKGKKGEEKKDSIGYALFNLVLDPSEQTDVSAAYPEIVSELKNIIEEHNIEIEASKRPCGIENSRANHNHHDNGS